MLLKDNTFLMILDPKQSFFLTIRFSEPITLRDNILVLIIFKLKSKKFPQKTELKSLSMILMNNNDYSEN